MTTAPADKLDQVITWPLRPLMTSLNGDNSWLLSFPRPATDGGSRYYFHIVFEPWLSGTTSQLHSWLITLALTSPAAYDSPESVERLAIRIEEEAAAIAKSNASARAAAPVARDDGYEGTIDAILVGFDGLDHLHEKTLRMFDPRIPFIGTPEVKGWVEPWGHFKSISVHPNMASDAKMWRSPGLHIDVLPEWLTVIRLTGHHVLNYVTCIIWTHASEDGEGEVHEAVLQSPHGTLLDQGPLQAFLDSEPQTKKLAMLHGLKESRAGGWKTTYGSEGGLALYRHIGGSKYWVVTHSSRLEYMGLILRFLVRDTPRTLQWALDKEAEETGEKDREAPNLIDVPNGESLALV